MERKSEHPKDKDLLFPPDEDRLGVKLSVYTGVGMEYDWMQEDDLTPLMEKVIGIILGQATSENISEKQARLDLYSKLLRRYTETGIASLLSFLQRNSEKEYDVDKIIKKYKRMMKNDK